MFRRWIQVLTVITLVVLAYGSLQYFFAYQRYQAYSAVLNECNDIEASVGIEDREWTAENKQKWEFKCDHSNKFSTATTKYGIYRSLSESAENTLAIFGVFIFLIVGSFIGRWIYRGNFKISTKAGKEG